MKLKKNIKKCVDLNYFLELVYLITNVFFLYLVFFRKECALNVDCRPKPAKREFND